MLPYTPLHFLLLKDSFRALVMTSGNMSEEPIAIDNQDAFKRLISLADYFLIHNRDIYLRSDDSVVKMINHQVRFFRRSRGYVPRPVFLKKPVRSILACGAELKILRDSRIRLGLIRSSSIESARAWRVSSMHALRHK